MFDWIVSYVTENPMFQGGLGLAVMGGLMYVLRALPGQIFNFLQNQFVTSLMIYSEDGLFDIMSNWMARNVLKHSRRLKIAESWIDDDNDDDGDVVPNRRERNFDFGPGTGWHFVKHAGHHFLVHRFNDEKSSNSWGNTRRENLCIYSLGRSREKLQTLLNSVIEELRRDSKRIPILMWDDGQYVVLDRRVPRPLDTIYVNEELKQEIVADLNRFIASRETYMQRGVPYRRGYFFEGPPGTGKSSFVFALAASLKRAIYVINPSSMSSDEALYAAFSRVPMNGIILIEDIDTNLASGARSKKPETPTTKVQRGGNKFDGITLSGLLNAIDGVWAKEGRILFITSNHPDKLDPALLRPGRIDVRRHIGLLGGPEVVRMYRAFIPDAKEQDILTEIKTPISGAELQGILLNKTVNAPAILTN